MAVSSMSKKRKLSIQCCIPEDVLFKEILTKLPVKSLMRFKSVSKSWLTLLSSDSFIADHFSHHSIANKPITIARTTYRNNNGNDKPVSKLTINKPEQIDMSYFTKARGFEFEFFELIGSSNGLLFLELLSNENDDENDNNDIRNDDDNDNANGDDEAYYMSKHVIWNPATKEIADIPTAPKTLSYSMFENYSFGFGEDCNNYKIVKIDEFHNTVCEANDVIAISLHVQLFIKTSGYWRQLEVITDYELVASSEGGVVIDQIIHWPLLHKGQSPAKRSVFKILTFDLNTDELKIIESPVFKIDCEYNHLELVKWKGCLGALTSNADGGESEFWLKSSKCCYWTKLFVIKPSESLWFLQGVLADKYLLFKGRYDQIEYFYDPISEKEKSIDWSCGSNVSLRFRNYLPSMISPFY